MKGKTGKKYVLKKTTTNGLVIYARLGRIMEKQRVTNTKELEKRRIKDEYKY